MKENKAAMKTESKQKNKGVKGEHTKEVKSDRWQRKHEQPNEREHKRNQTKM